MQLQLVLQQARIDLSAGGQDPAVGSVVGRRRAGAGRWLHGELPAADSAAAHQSEVPDLRKAPQREMTIHADRMGAFPHHRADARIPPLDLELEIAVVVRSAGLDPVVVEGDFDLEAAIAGRITLLGRPPLVTTPGEIILQPRSVSPMPELNIPRKRPLLRLHPHAHLKWLPRDRRSDFMSRPRGVPRVRPRSGLRRAAGPPACRTHHRRRYEYTPSSTFSTQASA